MTDQSNDPREHGVRLPGIHEIMEAHERISHWINRTPVLTNRSIDRIVGAKLYFKCENFQRVGAFKFRGASNTILQLSDEQASKGVATHSSGNHAQAVALGAQKRGIPAYIVMPENAPSVKVEAVKGYGAEITFCESTQAAREQTLEEIVEQTGAHFIHPYNDARVIAGQGTAALELIEDVPNLDTIMAPVGGGGLMSGSAIYTKAFNPNIATIGSEPLEADDAYRSLKSGVLQPSENPNTVADGLRTSLGSLTFEALSKNLDEIVTVSEEAIISAMRLIWERMNIIIEASCAVPLASLIEKSIDLSDQNVGIILTGGNVDLNRLPWQ